MPVAECPQDNFIFAVKLLTAVLSFLPTSALFPLPRLFHSWQKFSSAYFYRICPHGHMPAQVSNWNKCVNKIEILAVS